MIYLSGMIHPAIVGRHDMGFMLTPRGGNRPDLTRTWWAADTGCFARPEEHDDERYLAWIESFRRNWSRCLFATAPDVWGNAAATLDRSREMFPIIRRRVRVALCAQDGLETLSIPWDSFDCLFFGGSDSWKDSETAYALADEAKERGKWVHQGRCNTRRRLTASAAAGMDSADGTTLAFGPDANLSIVSSWLRRIARQGSLWTGPIEADDAQVEEAVS